MFQDYKVAYLLEHVKIKEAQHLSFIRQSVSYVLAQSARKIPHAGGIVPYDVTPLIEYSKASAAEIKPKEGESPEQTRLRRAVRKNYSAFFLKAMAHSLYHTPNLNSFLDYKRWRNGGILHIAEDINISYTVNTKFGVIKPIVRNSHLKNIEAVADEMRNLTRRARKTDANQLYKRAAVAYLKTACKQLNFKELSGFWMLLRALLWPCSAPDAVLKDVPEDQKLQVSDILGATCTLANIGMSSAGNQTVTVITPPELLMFGLGNLHLAPQVVNGEVVPRHMITLFTTFDHRAFDAGEVFPFFGHFQRYIDNPEKIYEWKGGDEI